MTLFDPGAPAPAPENESATRRRTRRWTALLAAGIHPATRLRLDDAPPGETCGTCAHHHAYRHGRRTFHKCDQHRLGQSNSAASDIRVSWPPCPLWAPIEDVTA